jgi:hypothetical protein
MKKLIVLLSLFLLNLIASAGQELEKFKQDVALLSDAQKGTPNNIISYADANGYLVKAVLNPERFERMSSESLENTLEAEQYKDTFEQFKPIINKYLALFKQEHGKYDEEYLDSLEILHQIVVTGIKMIQKANNANATKAKNEEAKEFIEAALKMSATVPKLIQKSLEKDIADGKFSMLFTPIAEKRLDKLRDLASK